MNISDLLSEAADGKLKLHIGCGRTKLKNWINIDNRVSVEPDVNFDLESCATSRLPFDDSSVDSIFCAHTLEHIVNILPLMQELYRVAKPGCRFLAVVPHGSNDAAYEDPTHVRHFFEGSFRYFGQSMYGGADYGYSADWHNTETMIVITDLAKSTCSSMQELESASKTIRNMLGDMLALMVAQKPARTKFSEFDNPDVSFTYTYQE